MYVIQVDNGVVTGTLKTHKIPDEGLPPGRVMVEIPDTDPHVNKDDYWLFGTYNMGTGELTPAPPHKASSVSASLPSQLDELLADIKEIKKKLKITE